jgi:NTP pyrophosphatase (non-canonical NTP hydrolase)
MTAKDYIKKALRTERKDYDFVATRNITPRIEHAIMGLVTEAGELMDAIKKAKIYGKDLDLVNLVEELGDVKSPVFWTVVC